MAKLTLNTIGSRYGSIDALNDNFNAIEAAIENTFSLDGTSPNALEADLDMNNNDILNAGEVSTDTLRINGVLVEPTTGVTAGAAFQTYSYTATAGQTTFSVSPATPYNASIVVIVNGLQLSPSEISVSGTNVITPALTLGDEVIIRRYTSEPVASPDASEVNFIQAGTGAVTRTSQAKMRDIVSVKDFGAVGDGVTDDTIAIQTAITFSRLQGGESRKLYWPRGTYLITASITLGSNQYIEFDQGVTINFVPAVPETTRLFGAFNQSNIVIIGNNCQIIGTRTGVMVDPSGGSGNAIELYGSDNIYIRNVIVKDFATDGFNIWGDSTGSDACNHVIIEGCQAINCRRNGMSIISVRNLQVIGGYYAQSNGAPDGPWAGIDIEPNADCFIEGISIIGVQTGENQGNGIQCTPGAFVGLEKRFDVNIIGHRSIQDGTVDQWTLSSFGCRNAMGFNTAGKVYGKIVYEDFTIESPKSSGIVMDSWPADQMPLVIIENGTIFNPNSLGTGVSKYAACGIVIFRSTFDTGIGNYGNLKVKNVHVEDLRSPAKLYSPVYVEGAVSGTTFKNMHFEDISGINYTNTSYGLVGFVVNISTQYQNCTATFNNKPSSVTGNISLWRFPGQEQQFSASGGTATLAAANYTIGTDYIVSCGAGVNSLTVTPATGDTIVFPVGVANASLFLDEGGYVHLRSVGGNTWNIIELRGNYRLQVSTNFQRRLVWASAAPVAGTWTQGDVVFNSAATVGQPKGWQCTVAGTPGTWVSMGNL